MAVTARRHDGEDGDDDAGPLRRCVATGASLPPERLVRFVVGPDGTIVPDVAGRLPGRGLWVTPDPDAIARALDRKLFARAAKRPVIAPPGADGTPLDGAGLAALTGRLLIRRAIEQVMLARRAGTAIAGFDAVRIWLQREGALASASRPALLVTAADAAPHGRDRLARLAAGVLGADAFATCEALTADELGEAFARERTVHILVAPGAFVGRIAAAGARLAAFRGPVAASAADGMDEVDTSDGDD